MCGLKKTTTHQYEYVESASVFVPDYRQVLCSFIVWKSQPNTNTWMEDRERDDFWQCCAPGSEKDKIYKNSTP